MAKRSLVGLVLACCTPALGWGHHAFTEYDQTKTAEIAGKLVEVHWQNPHVRLKMQSLAASGAPVVWDIEGHSVSILRRTNATPELLKAGTELRFAGWQSRRSPTRFFATNVLIGGKELVLQPGTPRHWKTGTVAGGDTSTWFDGGTTANASLGLFRVWSSKFSDPAATPGSLWNVTFPLTARGKAAVAAWNPDKDTITRGCEPKGMPTIMEQPYPIEFVKASDRILLKIEEYDAVRTIYLSKAPDVSKLPLTSLGHSLGRWEGPTLVVETTRTSWPYIDGRGVPQSGSAKFVERFTPNAEGSRLEYTVTVHDEAIFTKPVELKRAWVWRPGEQVKPYRCGAD